MSKKIKYNNNNNLQKKNYVVHITKTSAISLKNALNKSDLFIPRHHLFQAAFENLKNTQHCKINTFIVPLRI